MSGYALTPLAKADIFEIWCYIAEDSEEIADRVERAITRLVPLLLKLLCAAIPERTSSPETAAMIHSRGALLSLGYGQRPEGYFIRLPI